MPASTSSGTLRISVSSDSDMRGISEYGISRCSSAASASVWWIENSGSPVTTRSVAAHSTGAANAGSSARSRGTSPPRPSQSP